MESHSSLPKFIIEKSKRLEEAGIDSARAELEWILCHVLDLDRLNLYLHGWQLLDEEVRARVDEIIARRATRYPLQFILEEAWFYGRKFFVSPDVMAPTPETERLCEAAISFCKSGRLSRSRILDVGTGSGVIAVTMASELKEVSVVALDISDDALNVANKNAKALGVADRIEFRPSDFFSALRADEKFDLILSNPPYITEGDWPGLPPEVRADPKIAMTAGDDGLDAVRAILKSAPNYLATGGHIMFEIGQGQSEQIADLTSEDQRYRSFTCVKDLNDIDRVVVLSCDE